MPTYSYRCTECDHAFEIHQAFTDDALTTCPECSGALRKLFTGIGVVFKGSGFYRTDSRAERGASATSTSGSGGSSGSSTGSGSSSGSDGGSSSSTPSTSTSSSSAPKTAATTGP